MNRLRLMSIALATIALALSGVGVASASIGVGTTTPRIVIDQNVQPGGIYRLPVIPVINTGTQRTDFTVFVDRASKQSELFADPRWVTVSPGTVSLDASRSALINATISVPFLARPGNYQALIVAQPVVPGASANTPNVQVGTKVVFRIVHSNPFAALYWRIRSLLELWAPWSYILLALLVVLLLVRYVARRYRVSFAVSRRF